MKKSQGTLGEEEYLRCPIKIDVGESISACYRRFKQGD